MIGGLFRGAGAIAGKVATHAGSHALLVAMTGMGIASDIKKAKEEGRSPLRAGISAGATNILPLLMTAHIKSMSRQMLGFALLSNPMMVANAVKGIAVGTHRRYRANMESALPFSHTYQPTAQAYAHMQEGLQAMGNTSWAGSEAAVFSARYLNARY